MSQNGLRKAALYLSSITAHDRHFLLTELPRSVGAELSTLIHELASNQLNDSNVISELLGDEIRGLTIESSHSINELYQLSKMVSPEWFARIISANSSMDPRFLIALLDEKVAEKVKRSIGGVSDLPPMLKDSILKESSMLVKAMSRR